MTGRPRHLPTAAVVAVVVVVSGLVGAGLTTASAAQLSVGAGQLSTVDAGHPCAGTAAVVPADGSGTSYSAARIDVPEACAGRPVALVLLDGTTPLASGTVSAATSPTTTVPMTTYQASAVAEARAVVDGWEVDAEWSFTPPAGPAITCWTTEPDLPCAATVVVRNNHVWSWGYDLDIVVRDTRTASSNKPVAWTVQLDFANAQYPWVPNGVDGWNVLASSTCADLPVLTLTGRTDQYNTDLRRGTQLSFSIQPHNNGTGNLLACG